MTTEAYDIQGLLAIEQELSDRESLQARTDYLNNATSYSEVSINLRQYAAGEITTPQGTWGKTVSALITSLNSLINLANIPVIILSEPHLI